MLEELLKPRTAEFKDDWPRLTNSQINNLPKAFEYDYFDYLDEEGNGIIITFHRINKTLSDRPYVRIEYHLGDKKAVLLYFFDKFIFEKEGNKVRKIFYSRKFGKSNYIEIVSKDGKNIDAYHIVINFGKYNIVLNYKPIYKGFLPTPDGIFLRNEDMTEFCGSVCAAPRSKVDGLVVFDKYVKTLEGEGYHDHPYQSHPYGRQFSWVWSRIYTEKDGFVFIQLYNIKKNLEGGLFFLAHGTEKQMKIYTDIDYSKSDFHRDSLLGLKYARKHEIDAGKIKLTLTHEKTLLDYPVYHRSSVGVALNGVPQKTSLSYLEKFHVPLWMAPLSDLFVKKISQVEYKKTLKLLNI